MRILITGANFWGKGAASMLISTSTTLKRLIPDAEFGVASENLKFDSARGRKYGLNFFDGDFRHGVIFLSTFLRVLREFVRSDLIVDLSGFSFSDHFGKFGLAVTPSFYILLGKLLRKRFVMYSQAMGPLKSRWVRLLARLFLRKADLIIVRGERTRDYLQEVGIEKQVHVCADVAFLLQQAPAERVGEIMSDESIQREEGKLVIGVSVNARIYERCDPLGSDNTYVALMAKLADYLVEKLRAKVVFIPYEVSTKRYDDRSVAREIFKIAESKHGIRLIENEYSAEESKALIGNFDLFVGCRFHSIVASTSVIVPTIAIAWSHKYYETMRMLGLEKYVCHYEEMSLASLVGLVEDALNKKVQIKKELEVKVEDVRQSALEGAKRVRNLVRPLD